MAGNTFVILLFRITWHLESARQTSGSTNESPRQWNARRANVWSGFFDADRILTVLGLDDPAVDVAEFGCGYGTFTVAAAARTRGTVFALDIEPAMIEATVSQTRAAHKNAA